MSLLDKAKARARAANQLMVEQDGTDEHIKGNLRGELEELFNIIAQLVEPISPADEYKGDTNLKPGDIVFMAANAEEARPGWYVVKRFDHAQTRQYPEEGWWWECKRLADGIIQTICENSAYLWTEIEGAPKLDK